MAAPSSVRELNRLYVQSSTLQCALDLCRPCCYKVIVHGGKDIVPNQRPELCPRFQSPAAKKASDDEGDDEPTPPAPLTNALIATDDKTVLTVGDGNFSFSLAMTKYLASGAQLTATSHESKDTVLETYPDSAEILRSLDEAGARVLHEVDATNAAALEALGTFDRIMWNFPCVRMENGADGQNNEMEENKALLKGFFSVVLGSLAPGGEVHVTHKTKPPFGQWGILEIAAACGLSHLGSVVFDRCLYPGYSNKKVLSKGSFPIWDSETFVFVRPSDLKTCTFSLPTTMPESAAVDQGCERFVSWTPEQWEKEGTLIPMTPGIVRDIRILLSPVNKKQLEEKEKERKKRKLEALTTSLPEDVLAAKKLKRKPHQKKAPIKTSEKNKKAMPASKRNKKAKRHA
ncbi:hypothetical protein SPRG_05255 [Saprolegnia parasitica CBS 223.65]|uniref:25S rRNA (uridine-N(3))-methyltransferase BMT5-like domain-containing protein n=1 Tax=Saprolegnia parasitica (strain CBS 223.65) TaxID=695850 RepID=A0A067CH44_SAPPC|nr:hypothetical protein SPRG_05255 [Saprolegnia parasitica CBS 223.65]KDO30064.1 hypothetical protein SPRG_05255 [Saprolegnia parasitica CBS 223.65]|eukprot:XP_012199245.1 hypothetical protein SPRG_05255 [Saprolegnia parasitica CBS 223.65]